MWPFGSGHFPWDPGHVRLASCDDARSIDSVVWHIVQYRLWICRGIAGYAFSVWGSSLSVESGNSVAHGVSPVAFMAQIPLLYMRLLGSGRPVWHLSVASFVSLIAAVAEGQT